MQKRCLYRKFTSSGAKKEKAFCLPDRSRLPRQGKKGKKEAARTDGGP